MKTVPQAVLDLLKTRQFYSANLFTLTLFDGTIIRYTDGDRDINFNGSKWLCGGTTGPYFNRSAGASGNYVRAHWKIGVEVDTITFDVIPGSGQVKGENFIPAIRLGFFDQAVVQIDRAVMPTYGDTSPGVIPIFLGYASDVDCSRSVATFTVNGANVLMNRPVPFDVYQPGCLNTLYDFNCGLSRSAFATNATVASGSTAATINTAGLTQASDYFDLGTVKFTSGSNAGFMKSVQTYTHGSPSTIVLISPFPFIPQAGDAFTIYRGCAKTQAACNGFNNIANYRGFDYIPDNSTAVYMHDQRQAVIAEAMSWRRTPYHHMGRIKGVGCDCLTFIAEVFHNAGLIPKIEIPFYPMDWHLHRDAERYYEGLLKYANEADKPRPGSIALWKFGRCFSHAAIVIDWPRIIHSELGVGVVEENADTSHRLKFVGERGGEYGKPRPVRFFDFWER